MDLRDILNPVDEEPRSQSSSASYHHSQSTIATSASRATTAALDDGDTISEVSTDVQDDRFPNTPGRNHRGSSDTVPSTVPSADKHPQQRELPYITPSPSESRVYNRRANTSPIHLPALLPPPRRLRLVDDPESIEPVQQAAAAPFSIFLTLLNYAELTLEVAKNLDIDDLISLYAISRDFHRLVNARFTAMITAQWFTKASESGRTFIHRCYKNLCMRDPARRVNETKPSELRYVPSFRWLRMVLYRERVVDDILQCLRDDGHCISARATLTLKKIWFTMDISDNARRVGLMHNVEFWTASDLFFATMFFLKVDMFLTDPSTGNGEMGLRKMLLGQRSLSTLLRVMKREELQTQLELLRMIVRYSYEPDQHRDLPILGVPPKEIGKLQYEGWGVKETKFIQIDELVMREAIRRKMNMQQWYIEMLIWGYVHKQTFQDIWTPAKQAPKPKAEADSEEEEEEEQDIGNKGKGPRMRFFADDSDDGEQDGDVGEEIDEQEMDVGRYGFGSKTKGRMAASGKSKEDGSV